MNMGLNRMGFPSVGSWMTYGLGNENENLPGYVVMTDAKGRGLPKGRAQNWGTGFLPSVFQGRASTISCGHVCLSRSGCAIHTSTFLKAKSAG